MTSGPAADRVAPACRVPPASPAPLVRPARRVARIPRLAAYDQHCLRAETPARPLHVGILAVVDGRSLLDPSGRLRLEEVRRTIDERSARIPELRRVVFHPGRLAGAPLWVGDPAFDIDRHVGEAAVAKPGDEAALLALVERLVTPTLDRSRPLWRMWMLTGLEGNRVAVLVVVHHALADGLTAMRMVRSLLDPPRSLVPEPLVPPRPDPTGMDVRPAWTALVRDHARSVLASAAGLARPAAWRRAAGALWYVRTVTSLSRGIPSTSLNAPVGPRRKLALVRLDLADARAVARANGCGVNDVVLSLIAGGVRSLLAARGEPVERLRPRAGIAVALFSAGHAGEPGNDIGTLHVPLPLGRADPAARLPLIASERAHAGDSPMVAAEPIVRAWFGRFGPVRRAMERQRLVNLSETYLPGPPRPIELLTCPVLDLLPIAPLAGNLGLSFVALSYAGRLVIAVRADADRFPDLAILSAAMEHDWAVLAASASAPASPRAGAARSASTDTPVDGHEPAGALDRTHQNGAEAESAEGPPASRPSPR